MILHVDMDAFYASVEERDRPELVGQPVIVGGRPESRGVVAAANYVVRQFGVHSAMPTARALRLCPNAILLPVRMEYYVQVSRQIRQIIDRYTPLVEPLALDEAFLDVTGSRGLFGPPERIGQSIKMEILQEVKLVASVGVAPNKFLAKLASDLEKPDGFVVVDPSRIQEFLEPLPVSRLWGVGRVAGESLARLGVRTIGQLGRLPLETLQQQFGKSGEHLWQLAQGIDQRRVTPDREAKSISHETTFASDIQDMEVLRAWLQELVEQVARRLRRHELKGRTVHLKIRYDDFSTMTRSATLPAATNITHELWRSADQLLTKRLPNRRLSVRLLGMGVSQLESLSPTQLTLFDEPQRQKHSRLDAVSDDIKALFGDSALGTASGLIHGAAQKAQPKPDDGAGKGNSANI